MAVEQPVAWAFGASDNDDYASVTLWPAPGATYLELRGATPLPSSGSGRYRVRIDPPVPGHEDAWHTVDAAGNTPADIVLFSAAIEPSLAYKVTLDARGVGWHWANAWFLAEMGVRPLPRWIGHWGRVRRVFDAFRERLVFVIAGVAAVSVSADEKGADSRPWCSGSSLRAGASSRSATRTRSGNRCSPTTSRRRRHELLCRRRIVVVNVHTQRRRCTRLVYTL